MMRYAIALIAVGALCALGPLGALGCSNARNVRATEAAAAGAAKKDCAACEKMCAVAADAEQKPEALQACTDDCHKDCTP